MPFCPQCGSEFETGVLRCPDCEVALTQPPTSPAGERGPSGAGERRAGGRGSEEDLVEAYFADDEMETERISRLLTDAGIENSVFPDAVNIAVANLGLPAKGFRLMVLEKDLEAARRLIAEFKRSGRAVELGGDGHLDSELPEPDA